MSNANTQLTISRLRIELARLQHEHGDLPVVIDDADTKWRFLLKAWHLVVDSAPGPHGKRLAFSIEYTDTMED